MVKLIDVVLNRQDGIKLQIRDYINGSRNRLSQNELVYISDIVMDASAKRGHIGIISLAEKRSHPLHEFNLL